MMSTSPSFLVVNPAHLLDRFVADNGARWRLHGDPVHPPAGGRIPMGASVRPRRARPTRGRRRGGVANPFSGAGIDAVETGVLAGGVLDEALRTGQAASLQRDPQLIDERYGTYSRSAAWSTCVGLPATGTTRRQLRRRPAGVLLGADRRERQLATGPTPGRNRGRLRVGAAISTVVPDA